MTALHLVGLYKSSAPVVRALIEAGAEVEAFNGDQESPLHWAAAYNPVVVQVLVQANAKVNVLDKWNWSPLYLAARANNIEAVVCLCEAGADPHLGHSPDVPCQWYFNSCSLSAYEVDDDMKALISMTIKKTTKKTIKKTI